jgi:hypothetical protein
MRHFLSRSITPNRRKILYATETNYQRLGQTAEDLEGVVLMGLFCTHLRADGQRRQEIGGEEGACKLEKELSRLVDIGAERKSRARRLLRRL